MCVVSMVADHYRDRFHDNFPQIWPHVQPPQTNLFIPDAPVISREEFDQLKRDVADMKELLKKAKAYDERNNEPDCEIDEKVDLLKRIAKLVGVELGDVLSPKSGA